MKEKQYLGVVLLAGTTLVVTIIFNSCMLRVIRHPYNEAMGVGMFRIPTSTLAADIGRRTFGLIEWQGKWTSLYLGATPAFRIPDTYSLDYGMRMGPAIVLMLVQAMTIAAGTFAAGRYRRIRRPNHRVELIDDPLRGSPNAHS